jgi:hypothetical protein
VSCLGSGVVGTIEKRGEVNRLSGRFREEREEGKGEMWGLRYRGSLA